MSTTRHRAGFETGNHSSSPLQGAITRGALHVPQRTPTEGHHTASQKREENKMSARHAVSLGVSVQNYASAGGEKSRPGRMCRSWGPKYLRRQSEIKAGLLAWTARVRSGRDHPDREHVDHRTPEWIQAPRALHFHSQSTSPTAVPWVKKGGPRCGRRGQSGQLEHGAPPV